MRGELNGNDYINKMKDKKERKKKKNPMEIFDKKTKTKNQKSRVKLNGDKIKNY